MSKEHLSKSIRIQISEPWDFDIPGRGSVLNGKIEGICESPTEKRRDGEYLLISLDQPIEWRGEVIKQLLVSPRYEGDGLECLQDAKHMTVGIGRVKPGYSLRPGQSFAQQQIDYFAIGSAQLCGKS